MKNYDNEIRKHYLQFPFQVTNLLKSFSEENKVQFKNKNELTNDEKKLFSYLQRRKLHN